MILNTFSDYDHLDPQVPGEQPGVGVVLLLLELDLRRRGQSRLFKLLQEVIISYPTCSMAAWILRCQSLTHSSSCTRLDSTKSGTLSSPILSKQGV